MKLRDYLKSSKIKVSDFAKMIDVAQATVSGYTTGSRPRPRPEIARRIVEATGGQVTYEDLYGRPALPASTECQEAA